MTVGSLVAMTIARVFVLFNADCHGVDPVSFTDINDIPDHIMKSYVMEIIIPQSTKWYDGGGVIMITYKYGNF